MGAPKLKWTSEEEAALKAGIHKYGVGKWSTILKDDEFSAVLRSRSNVDLKDKWRNLNCLITGSGSRQRFRVSMNRNSPAPRYTDEATSRGMQSVAISEETEVYDVTSPESPESPLAAVSTNHQISRLDDVVLDVIQKLNEPRGSSRAVIGQYIEEHYVAPPDFERALAENLRSLTENGRLIKVKHQYRIAPRPICFGVGKGPVLFMGSETRRDAPEFERNDVVRVSKEQIDAELEKMRYMTASEAAAAAALAVAEAEAAIAEAEAAAREAEEAEAEAEAAQCFADAAQKSLNFPTIFAW